MSNIVTVENLGDYLGLDLTNDPKAALIISAVNAFIENYTGRVFGEVKDFNEQIDYEPVIFLSHIDISEVSMLKINNVEMTGYKWNRLGRIVLSASGRGYVGKRSNYDLVDVQYKSGMADVPADLISAALQLAADNFNQSGTQNVSQASVGGYSLTFASVGGGSGSADSASGANVGSFSGILNTYRVRKV